MAAAASGQALTKNQKKKLKKKLKKQGSQASDSGQQQEASHTDSDGSCGTGRSLPVFQTLQ